MIKYVKSKDSGGIGSFCIKFDNTKVETTLLEQEIRSILIDRLPSAEYKFVKVNNLLYVILNITNG